MKITIEVYYTMYDMRSLRRGSFEVIKSEFVKDEMKEVTRVALEFIRWIQWHSQSRITVDKVIYNGDKNITEYLTKFL